MTELPEGWTTATIGDLATTIRGVTYKKSDSSNLPGEGLVPLLRATNFDDGVETGGDLVYIPATLVKPEQVLMESDLLVAMSSGSIAVVGKSVPIGQPSHQRTFGAFCGVIRPNPATNARFLHHHSASPSIRQSWSDSARGTNINNLKPRTVESTAVPVPPPQEQDEIVRILDTQLARLDTVMGAVQAVRGNAAQFRRSLLHAAFTGQLTQPDPSRGGALPDAWSKRGIGELAAVKGGKRLPKGTAWSPVRTEHPYIRATDVKMGHVDQSALVYVSDEVWPRISQYVVEASDILITIAGTIGRVAQVPLSLAGANLTENAARIALRSTEAEGRFLERFLQSPEGQNQISSRARATSQSKLALERIRTVAVPIPPGTEQSEIVQILDSQLARLEKALEVADRVEVECGRLRRSLLQSAFTGELTKKWREANG